MILFSYLFVSTLLLAGDARERFRTVLVFGQQRCEPFLRRYQLHPAQIVGHVGDVHGKATDGGHRQQDERGHYRGGHAARHQVSDEQHYRLYGH